MKNVKFRPWKFSPIRAQGVLEYEKNNDIIWVGNDQKDVMKEFQDDAKEFARPFSNRHLFSHHVGNSRLVLLG